MEDGFRPIGRSPSNIGIGNTAPVSYKVGPAVDLNPIENAWSKLKKRQRIKKATLKQALKKVAVKVWRTITPEYLDRLYHSMPRRMAAVIAAHGGHTKYRESFWTCI